MQCLKPQQLHCVVLLDASYHAFTMVAACESCTLVITRMPGGVCQPGAQARIATSHTRRHCASATADAAAAAAVRCHCS
jgi:hypothetical protein